MGLTVRSGIAAEESLEVGLKVKSGKLLNSGSESEFE